MIIEYCEIVCDKCDMSTELAFYHGSKPLARKNAGWHFKYNKDMGLYQDLCPKCFKEAK